MAGFENTFQFFMQHCKLSTQGFSTDGAVRPFAVPGEEESFSEEDLLKLFDRKDLEEKYEAATKAVDTESIHADMMVPSLKNDYVAGVHRDVFLRHTGRIARFVAEANRRKNHEKNIHGKRQKDFINFENLKPMSPESSE